MRDAMTTFRIRLPLSDVEQVKDLARTESCRRHETVNWCDLIREALVIMARERRPVA